MVCFHLRLKVATELAGDVATYLSIPNPAVVDFKVGIRRGQSEQVSSLFT